MVHVAYMREAWVSKQNNSVRVTVDRSVRGEPRYTSSFETQMANPVYPFGRQRVLELKFTDRFPDWFHELVRLFNLVQTGAPKYCGSIAESGDTRIGRINPMGMRQRLIDVLEYC